MSERTQDEPIMDGSTEATASEKAEGLQQQVEHDRAGDGAAAKADELEDRAGEVGLDGGAARDR